MKLLSTLVISGSFVLSSFAADLHGTKEMLLDNEQVQVVRLSYPPGAESGMHTHQFPNRVVYFVSGGKLELIPDDATIENLILEVKDGDTLFVPATTHNVKNIGSTKLVMIETEIK